MSPKELLNIQISWTLFPGSKSRLGVRELHFSNKVPENAIFACLGTFNWSSTVLVGTFIFVHIWCNT